MVTYQMKFVNIHLIWHVVPYRMYVFLPKDLLQLPESWKQSFRSTIVFKLKFANYGNNLSLNGLRAILIFIYFKFFAEQQSPAVMVPGYYPYPARTVLHMNRINPDSNFTPKLWRNNPRERFTAPVSRGATHVTALLFFGLHAFSGQMTYKTDVKISKK